MTKPIFIIHAGVADVAPEDRNEYLQAITDSLDEELDAHWHVIVSSNVNSNTNRFEAFAVEKIEHIDFEALKELLLKDIENEFDIRDEE